MSKKSQRQVKMAEFKNQYYTVQTRHKIYLCEKIEHKQGNQWRQEKRHRDGNDQNDTQDIIEAHEAPLEHLWDRRINRSSVSGEAVNYPSKWSWVEEKHWGAEHLPQQAVVQIMRCSYTPRGINNISNQHKDSYK